MAAWLQDLRSSDVYAATAEDRRIREDERRRAAEEACSAARRAGCVGRRRGGVAERRAWVVVRFGDWASERFGRQRVCSGEVSFVGSWSMRVIARSCVDSEQVLTSESVQYIVVFGASGKSRPGKSNKLRGTLLVRNTGCQLQRQALI